MWSRWALCGVVIHLLGCLGSVFSVAHAADGSELSLRLTQHHVVTVHDGEETREELRALDAADQSPHSSPGDVVEYVLMAENSSDTALNDVVIALPIPLEATYLDGSARFDPDRTMIQFSVDHGRQFHAPPVRYWQIAVDGNRELKVADPTMYTNVRWVFLTPLDSKEVVTLRFRIHFNEL